VPRAGSALAAAEALPVKGRAPKTGYDRDNFGSGWATKSTGCDTRETVLRRDISRIKILAGSGGCTVVGGHFLDPYSGISKTVTHNNISSIDIDHVVALSDAWQKGAQSWTAGKRIAFANDLINLLATSESINSAKGDGDTATWLPPRRSFRCHYVARQVSVKTKYGLWVTRAEKDAMKRVLSTCPDQRLITPAQARRVKDPTPDIVHLEPSTPKREGGGHGNGLDPRFGTCREAIDAGYGPYVRGRDPEYYWYSDRDDDGVVCER
jgi:hypothetical protein